MYRYAGVNVVDSELPVVIGIGMGNGDRQRLPRRQYSVRPDTFSNQWFCADLANLWQLAAQSGISCSQRWDN
jgi:hypothetical protein